MSSDPARRSRFQALGEGLFLVAAGAMLLLPMLGHLLGRQEAQSDNRALAAAPALPASWDAAAAWPRQVDRYLDDHFGFRRELVELATRLRWRVLASPPVPDIVVGRNGRLFFSPGDVPLRAVLGTCGAWWPEARTADVADSIARGLRAAQRVIPGLSILVVPTSPVLYPQELPRWIARSCAGHRPEAQEVLDRLPPDERRFLAYPRDIAAGLPAETPLVPPHNFHWDGAGVHEFVGRFAEHEMGLRRQASPSWRVAEKEADLGVYFPGVALSNRVRLPDWSGSGAHSCTACTLPPLDGVTLPNETMRLQREGQGGRLLLLGDSFIAGAADAMIGYFNDIIMINLNNAQRLSPEERRALWTHVTRGWQPDRVLMLVNDGNVDVIPRYLGLLLEAAAP